MDLINYCNCYTFNFLAQVFSKNLHVYFHSWNVNFVEIYAWDNIEQWEDVLAVI